MYLGPKIFGVLYAFFGVRRENWRTTSNASTFLARYFVKLAGIGSSLVLAHIGAVQVFNFVVPRICTTGLPLHFGAPAPKHKRVVTTESWKGLGSSAPLIKL